MNNSITIIKKMKRLTFVLLVLSACLLLPACKKENADIDAHYITRVVIRDPYGITSTKDRHDIKMLISAINKAAPDATFDLKPKIVLIELYFNDRLAYILKSNESFFTIEDTQYREKTGAFEDAVSAIRNERREKSVKSKLDYLQTKIKKI